MASNLKVIQTDAEFATELANAGTKLVVVDYFANWCDPCRTIAPVFAELATKYSKVKFMKVDVDNCQNVSHKEGVTAMPTFIFYRNKVKIDMMRGADGGLLEERIKKHQSQEEGDDGDSPVKGHMDLTNMINKSASECLNGSDDHIFEHCLTSTEGYLESDVDAQLILNLGFNQALKLHSLKIHCSEENGPKTIKLFINQTHTLDFDAADGMEPLQQLDLTPDDLDEGALIPLKFVKLQNVSNLTLFIRDNQNGDDSTRIDCLTIIGSPTSTTNMAEFKRVAGKAGESH